MKSAIENRRSIRKFDSRALPDETVDAILDSACLAPSGKNRQPWRFIAVKGAAKSEMLDTFARGLEREEHTPLLPEDRQHIPGAKNSLAIMRQAPVVVFVLDTLSAGFDKERTRGERIAECVNTQSVGAAVQNMLLAATQAGIGSLWICDILYALPELTQWLGEDGVPIAAVALGYAAEHPPARPRKPRAQTIVWHV